MKILRQTISKRFSLRNYLSIHRRLVKVTVDGEEIKTTETHPWYVEGKGFIYAEYIEVGDKVRTDYGEVKIVEKVEEEKLPIKIVVINLTVQDNRTYFVGENEILVHNSCMETELPKWATNAVYDISKLNNTGNFKNGALEHVLEGELNARGKAVGFHYEGMPTAVGNIIQGT